MNNNFIHDPRFHDVLEAHENTTILIEPHHGDVGAVRIHEERYLTVQTGDNPYEAGLSASDLSKAKRRNDLRDRLTMITGNPIKRVMTIYNG